MTTPYRQGSFLGWLPPVTGTSTSQVNAAANWAALAFIPDAARTLSAARAFVSAITGTLAGTDITCDLYDSTGTSGAPGASIATGKLPSATITASGWYDFTGFSTALTAGTPYWLVFKNANAVPATNNCTFRACGSYANWPPLGSAVFQWGLASSTNSGSTWGTSTGFTALRVAYADGSYDGVPFSNSAAAAVGDGVYATHESGVKFTTPPNGVLNVRGLAMLVSTKTGSPTGSMRLGLWTGSTPANQGYTNAIPATPFATNGIYYGHFASTLTLQPGTVTRITLGETAQSDASGNRFNLREITPDTDSNSVILLPWEGTATKTYFDGSSWADATLGTSLFGHALLLDTAGEFGAGASGATPSFGIGGPLFRGRP